MENFTTKHSNQRRPKAFISCLPDSVSLSDLKEYMSTVVGLAPEILIQKKKDAADVEITNAVLTFNSEAVRDNFIGKGHAVKGQKLKISRYMEENELKEHLEDIRSRQVYIKKLPVAVTDEELERIFAPYGRIRKAYSFKGKRYKKRRRNFKYGYVIFEDPSALKFVPEDGIFYRGRRIKWSCYRMKLEKRIKRVKKETGEEHLLRPAQSRYHQTGRRGFCAHKELFLNLGGDRFAYISKLNVSKR